MCGWSEMPAPRVTCEARQGGLAPDRKWGLDGEPGGWPEDPLCRTARTLRGQAVGTGNSRGGEMRDALLPVHEKGTAGYILLQLFTPSVPASHQRGPSHLPWAAPRNCPLYSERETEACGC